MERIAARGGRHDSYADGTQGGGSQALRRKPRRLMTAQGRTNDGHLPRIAVHTGQGASTAYGMRTTFFFFGAERAIPFLRRTYACRP